MTARDLLAELRGLVDERPDLLRERIGALTGAATAEALHEVLLSEALHRAAAALNDGRERAAADPAAFAAALDDARRISDALGDMPDLASLTMGVFALKGAEAHLVVFERGLRELWQRRAAEGTEDVR